MNGQCNQAGRDYIMKDFTEVSLNPDPQDSFLGIFDRPGGPEVGNFARNHLWHP